MYRLLGLFLLFIGVSGGVHCGAKASLHYQEISRAQDALGPTVTWTCAVGGCPAGQVYQFAVNTLSNRLAFCYVALGEDGRLVRQLDAEKLLLTFDLSSVRPGEPVQLSLKAVDDSVETSLVVIPFPIEVRDGLGHNLSLVRVDREAQVFRISASGYKPLEDLQFTLRVGEEEHTQQLSANTYGYAQSVVSTQEKGRDGGVAWLSLKPVAEEEQLTLAYHWGTSALR